MKPYTSHFVASKDGTMIHYRQMGSGDGLLLVHGALMYSGSFMRLAEVLAQHFTVYIPDRCGRGKSKAHQDHSLLSESEDIQAILNQTNTRYLFGLSSGAIIALQTALLYPALQKVVLYEPPLPVDTTEAHLLKLERDFEQAIAKQHYGSAFIVFMKMAGDKGSWMKLLPRVITSPLMNKAIENDAKKRPENDQTSLKSLLMATKFDNCVVRQSQGILDMVPTVFADILLLGGEKSHPFLKKSLDSLHAAIPHAKRINLPNVGHIAASNNGKPELVANELNSFFSSLN